MWPTKKTGILVFLQNFINCSVHPFIWETLPGLFSIFIDLSVCIESIITIAGSIFFI